MEYLIKGIILVIFFGGIIYVLYSNWKENKKKYEQEELDRLEVVQFRAFQAWSNYVEDNDGYEFIKLDVRQKELYRAWCESKLVIYEFRHEINPKNTAKYIFDIIQFMDRCPDEDHKLRVLNLLFYK